MRRRHLVLAVVLTGLVLPLAGVAPAHSSESGFFGCQATRLFVRDNTLPELRLGFANPNPVQCETHRLEAGWDKQYTYPGIGTTLAFDDFKVSTATPASAESEVLGLAVTKNTWGTEIRARVLRAHLRFWCDGERLRWLYGSDVDGVYAYSYPRGQGYLDRGPIRIDAPRAEGNYLWESNTVTVRLGTSFHQQVVAPDGTPGVQYVVQPLTVTDYLGDEVVLGEASVTVYGDPCSA